MTDMIDELDGLFQVEINSMDDALLRRLFQEGIDEFWSAEAFDDVIAREDEERDQL